MQVMKKSILILTVILLTACAKVATVPTFAPAAQITPVPTLVGPTPMASQFTPLTILTSTSLPPAVASAMNGLRMAFIVDGNLYVQDDNNPSVQLTHSGEDQEPLISDDGKKVVFYRGKSADNIYVINADGSQEQLSLSNGKLNEQGWTYDEATEVRTFRSLTFISGTHTLLFNTYQIERQNLELKYKNHDYKIGLLSLNVDSGAIKQLLAPGLGGNFQVSPDGKLLSIVTPSYIDIFDIDGQIARHNLVTYTPSTPIALFPSSHWLPDSNGILVFLPVKDQYDVGDIPTYAIWRYLLDENTGSQILLDPPPMGTGVLISPDKKWLLYNREPESGQNGVPLYIGNLHASVSRLYAMNAFTRGWSADNTHFIYEGNKRELFLGSVDQSPIYIDEGNFLGWVNASYYIYSPVPNAGNIIMGGIHGERIIIQTTLAPKGVTWFNFVLLP